MGFTYEGLCKFDRSTEKFTRYKPFPNAKFSDPNISAINEDSDGMMWVGSFQVDCAVSTGKQENFYQTIDLDYPVPDTSRCKLHL